MHDDYLWDRSGAPDADVERLEQLLGRLRSTRLAPRIPISASGGAGGVRGVRLQPDIVSVNEVRLKPDATDDSSTTDDSNTDDSTIVLRWKTARFLAPALAAAAAIVMMVGVTWQTARNARASASWQVAAIEGQPRIGSTALAGSGTLAVGQTLMTDAVSRARVEVGTIGEVTVGPDSRVRLVAARDGHHRLALARGTLRAVITAPPGQFIVDTPSATATDLGCAYTLHVDEDGSGLLSVTAGWVSLQLDGRESFVPAGASARIDPKLGPGTPRYDDEDREYQDTVDAFDFGDDEARRAEALRVLMAHSHSADALTLWHLVARVGAADRPAVVDALADQVAMPPGVTRDAILRLDRDALDRWWDALGLGDTSWWRKWKLANW